jgi:hypothetical protein
MSFENDDVYVDLLVTNSIQTDANSRVPVSFMQNSSQAILKNTNGYKLSIIRFSLNTESLPIFIPSMKSANTTIYSFTMEMNGVQYQQYVEYEPQNINPIDPDEYYFVYNYQFLIYLLNQSLISCLSNLALLTQCPTSICPVISFDNTTQKCTIKLDNTVYGYNESTKINIYMNFAMYSLLASLPSCTVNKDKYGMDYQLNNLISPFPNLLTQEYSTVALWNPISSVIFTSNLIPIYQSQTPPVEIYENGALVNASSSYNFLNIMTDFIANNMEFVPFVQYAPSIYRFLTLKPNSEIRNIDIQVYWMNKNTGNLKKLYIGVGGSCSVKLFLTKSF